MGSNFERLKTARRLNSLIGVETPIDATREICEAVHGTPTSYTPCCAIMTRTDMQEAIDTLYARLERLP